MPRAVAWPMLLRPPDLRRPSVSALTGLPLWSAERSTSTRPRRAGPVGLYCFNAISSPARSNAGGHVDRRAFGERNDRLLLVGAHIGATLPALRLALLDNRVHARDRDVEQRLDGCLDLGLGRRARNLEDD